MFNVVERFELFEGSPGILGMFGRVELDLGPSPHVCRELLVDVIPFLVPFLITNEPRSFVREIIFTELYSCFFFQFTYTSRPYGLLLFSVLFASGQSPLLAMRFFRMSLQD